MLPVICISMSDCCSMACLKLQIMRGNMEGGDETGMQRRLWLVNHGPIFELTGKHLSKKNKRSLEKTLNFIFNFMSLSSKPPKLVPNQSSLSPVKLHLPPKDLRVVHNTICTRKLHVTCVLFWLENLYAMPLMLLFHVQKRFFPVFPVLFVWSEPIYESIYPELRG